MAEKNPKIVAYRVLKVIRRCAIFQVVVGFASHFGSYIHSLPMGKLFTAQALIGVIGGLRNFVDRAFGGHHTKRNFTPFGVTSILPANDIVFKL
jgi:hypothetical protein